MTKFVDQPSTDVPVYPFQIWEFRGRQYGYRYKILPLNDEYYKYELIVLKEWGANEVKKGQTLKIIKIPEYNNILIKDAPPFAKAIYGE